jgi:dihydrofolate reductase
MRKIIAAINMTLDGSFDHTSVDPDEEIHQHYADLLHSAEAILYGRITFELMRYWQDLVKHPSGEKSLDDFAIAMDRTPKVVFSRTLKTTGWESARLAARALEEEVLDLGKGSGKDIYVGSRSLIIQLLNHGLIDELQLCVHPVIAGGGRPLFQDLKDRTVLKLGKTKMFRSGAILLYYEPQHRRTQ